MLQAAAGPWAEWLVTSAVAVGTWRFRLPVLAPVLYRFVVLNTLTIASNLLPFVGLDGSFLLADALREPDLTRRSRGGLSRVATSLRLRQRPTGEETALAAYATANAAVGAALVAVAAYFWYELFGDTLTALVARGPAGWLLVVGAITVLLGPAVRARTGARSTPRVHRRSLAERVRFRLERRWRVAAVEAIQGLPQFCTLNAAALGIVAGGIERVRASAVGRTPTEPLALRIVHGRHELRVSDSVLTHARAASPCPAP
jgi:hypothetical protein